MQYQVEENCLTIFLPKEVDHHNAEEIRKEADQVIAKKHIKHVIFDFSSTNFMDSSGIALILRSQQRMQLLDGSVVIRNIPAQAKRVLDAAGIGRLVSIK